MLRRLSVRGRSLRHSRCRPRPLRRRGDHLGAGHRDRARREPDERARRGARGAGRGRDGDRGRAHVLVPRRQQHARHGRGGRGADDGAARRPTARSTRATARTSGSTRRRSTPACARRWPTRSVTGPSSPVSARRSTAPASASCSATRCTATSSTRRWTCRARSRTPPPTAASRSTSTPTCCSTSCSRSRRSSSRWPERCSRPRRRASRTPSPTSRPPSSSPPETRSPPARGRRSASCRGVPPRDPDGDLQPDPAEPHRVPPGRHAAQPGGAVADALAGGPRPDRPRARRRAHRDRGEGLDLAGAATTRAVITILVTLAAVVASILVAGFIARAIVNPLRRLTDAAEDVREQLPKLVEQVAVPGQGPGIDLAPITVESSDEVGQLATAFNDVNQTTIKVAREQAALRGSIAEMFVNVARRDQVLLNRQLAFLDDLERSEEDAGTLSNLFRLDHLATRMRRNAESLLVLAGIDSAVACASPCRPPTSSAPRPPRSSCTTACASTSSSTRSCWGTTRSTPRTCSPSSSRTRRCSRAAHARRGHHGPRRGLRAHHGPRPRSGHDGRGDRGGEPEGRDARGLGRRRRPAPGSVRGRSSRGAPRRQGPLQRGGDEQGTEVVVSFPAVLFVPDSNVPLPQPTDPLETRTQAAAQQLTSTGVMPALPAEPAAPAPVPTASVAAVEPEAPAGVPVDLDALTDGTTQTGMPRRRSRTVDPAAAAPSASFASGPQTGAIVLPPLATPALPDELPAGTRPGPRPRRWPRDVGAAEPLPCRRDPGRARLGRDPGARRQHPQRALRASAPWASGRSPRTRSSSRSRRTSRRPTSRW